MKHDFEINEPRYSLKKIGFTDKPLSKKEMVGNHFQIKIVWLYLNIEKNRWDLAEKKALLFLKSYEKEGKANKYSF